MHSHLNLSRYRLHGSAEQQPQAQYFRSEEKMLCPTAKLYCQELGLLPLLQRVWHNNKLRWVPASGLLPCCCQARTLCQVSE